MAGSGRTIVGPGIAGTISSTSTKGIDGSRVLENRGSLVYSGNNLFLGLNASATGRIVNAAGAVFEIQGEADVHRNFSGAYAFENAGLLRKAGGGTSSFESGAVALVNTGTVLVEAGTLQLAGGGSLGGSIDVQADGALTLAGGVFTSTAEGLIGGAGAIALTGGSATINFQFVAGSRLSISAGTWSFDTDQTFSQYVQSGGTLAGSGTVTVTESFAWTAGTMAGSGRTIVGPGIAGTISSTSTKGIDGSRVLENRGSLVYSGNNLFLGLNASATGRIVNAAGAVFEIQGEADVHRNFSGAYAFENAGLLRKAGGGTSSFESTAVVLVNTGEIELLSGSLQPMAGFAQNGIVRGSGTLVANVVNNGIFRPDPVPGGIVVQGTFAQTAGGRIDLRLAASDPLLQHRALRVTGAATLNGALDIALRHPFAEAPGASFPVVSFASRAGDFAIVTGLTDNFGYAFSRAFTATSLDLTVIAQGDVPTPPSPLGIAQPNDFSHWIAAHAEAAAVNNHLGPNDDPDGDGAPNLVEYAFGTSPFDAHSVIHPVPGLVVDPHHTWATLEFRRRLDSPSLLYEILESSDLLHWSPVADTLILSRSPVPGQPDIESIKLAIWPALVPHQPCFLTVRIHAR